MGERSLVPPSYGQMERDPLFSGMVTKHFLWLWTVTRTLALWVKTVSSGPMVIPGSASPLMRTIRYTVDRAISLPGATTRSRRRSCQNIGSAVCGHRKQYGLDNVRRKTPAIQDSASA